MRMKNFQWILFFIVLENFSVAYEDKNLNCEKDGRLTGLSKNINGKTKNIGGKCSAFSPAVTDITCKKGKSFKCDGQFENCADPHAWIGGFQILDMGNQVEIYTPYCCTSSKIKMENKCQIKTKNGNFDYNVPSNSTIYRISCQYVTTSDKKTMKDMNFGFEECAYIVSSGNTHPGTPAKSVKAASSQTEATKVVRTTPAGPTVDPNLCFTRLLVRNKALDYVDDPKPMNIIATIPASDPKECAGKCYSSEKTLNRRCRSFRFSDSNCSLRESYMSDRVKNLPAPINAVYGNWTSADCSGK